jgi:hypothetical protein
MNNISSSYHIILINIIIKSIALKLIIVLKISYFFQIIKHNNYFLVYDMVLRVYYYVIVKLC